MSYHLGRKLYSQMKMSAAFSEILGPFTKWKKCKNGSKSASQILSKWMTGPPPDQNSVHWTINCGQCWRNVPAFWGTKISTHWKLWLWRQWEKFPWPWFVNQSMTGPNIFGPLYKQNVVILNNDFWIIVFFEIIFKFLKNFISISFVFAPK